MEAGRSRTIARRGVIDVDRDTRREDRRGGGAEESVDELDGEGAVGAGSETACRRRAGLERRV